MSGEKSAEVVGCDASIMKNVWEIREREYRQRMLLEQDRMDKSALPSINRVWEKRLIAKLGNYRRVEKKPKPAEAEAVNNNNNWKSRRAKTPGSPHGAGPGPMGRPGNQSKGFSTPVTNSKDKEGQDRKFNRLQLLMLITYTQPSARDWGKSWRYDKSLPAPEDGSAAGSDWGQCWMFATQQPYSEAGKPWPNGPNMMDPHRLHLWKKPGYRVVESQDLDLSLPAEEWQESWRKPDKENKKEDTSSENGENAPKSASLASLLKTQKYNDSVCSTEWMESWKSTKSPSKNDHFTPPNKDLVNESNKHEDRKNSSTWDEGWRFVNHKGGSRTDTPTVEKSHSPEWAHSWRAVVGFNDQEASDLPLTQDDSETHDDCKQQKEPHLQKVMHVSHERRHKDLNSRVFEGFQDPSEWTESWHVVKNNSTPSEKMKDAQNISPPLMESQKSEDNLQGQYSTSEDLDPSYEQLKHSVIYCPKTEFTHSRLPDPKQLEIVHNLTEWRESWRAIKHRMRMERRRMRSDPSRPFGESEKEGHTTSSVSEWKDSWKFNCHPLHQEPELWQAWSTTPQIRPDQVRDPTEYVPVQLPKNGPTEEQSWGESWMFSRHQHRQEPGQSRAQKDQRGSNAASPQLADSHARQRSVKSMSDWQSSWMVSETEFHHDKPSFTQWMESWRFVFQKEHRTEQLPRGNYMEGFMDGQPQRDNISLQGARAKIRRSFDDKMYGESNFEKEWSAAWRAGSLQSHQQGNHGSPGTSGTTVRLTTSNEQASKWVESFRLANPSSSLEQQKMESSPTFCPFAVMWSKGKNIQIHLNTNFSNNPASFKLWGTSHQFLQGASAQIKNQSKEPADPWLIASKKTKTRRHLHSNIEKEKKSEKKWAGCHLLGKAQPRPKKTSASVKKIKVKDEAKDVLFEEWAESWRSWRSGPKKHVPVKMLLGWDESWKFLFPPYQTVGGRKAK